MIEGAIGDADKISLFKWKNKYYYRNGYGRWAEFVSGGGEKTTLAIGGDNASDGQNWIWFRQSIMNEYFLAGATVFLSVPTFTVEGVEQIIEEEVLSFDTTDSSVIMPAVGSNNGWFRISNPTSNTNANISIKTFTDWVEHLNELTNPNGVIIGDERYNNAIYFQDKDWSITIKRDFDAVYSEPIVPYFYRLTYDSASQTMLAEYGNGNFWQTNSYINTKIYKVAKNL